jgi:hypothetical protein
MTRTRVGAIATALLSAMAILGTGCGQMTIRTWATLIEEGSGGFVALTNPATGLTSELDILRLQGGFLVVATMNTAQLPGPMSGTISLPDVRMAGEVEVIGKLCTWNDPEGFSGGSLTIDLLRGTTESELFLDAKATTGLSELFGVPPVDFEESLDMDLGGGLGLEQFLNAFLSGSPAGLFETSATMESTMDMMGLEATFAMTTLVTNGAEPPLIDSDLMEFCGDEFASQEGGDALFYGVNAKSAYLRHAGNDRPVEPLVISLAEAGAAAGDTLRLKTVGTYSFLILLKDGVDTRLGGVFSTTDEVLDSSYLFRLPGAIDAGPNVNTWVSIFCIFGQCADLGGDDIPEDFLINPQMDIVVPPGAEYLITAPIDPWRLYGDNSGMGFGVSVEVNPE